MKQIQDLFTSLMTKFMMVFTLAFVLCVNVYAQVTEAVASATVVVASTDQDFLMFLMQSIGGMKGASTLAILGLSIKILLKLLDTSFVEKFFGSKFSDWTGGLKLTVVLLLSFAGGIVTLMLPPLSLSIGAALVHSTTLSAFLVLSNQIHKHYIEKKK